MEKWAADMARITADHERNVRRIESRRRLMNWLLFAVVAWALFGCSAYWRETVRYWPTCGRCETRCAP